MTAEILVDKLCFECVHNNQVAAVKFKFIEYSYIAMQYGCNASKMYTVYNHK